jgi:hypothetical protein
MKTFKEFVRDLNIGKDEFVVVTQEQEQEYPINSTTFWDIVFWGVFSKKDDVTRANKEIESDTEAIIVTQDDQK